MFGRDIFSRLVIGARITLAISLSANAIAMLVGSIVGILGGYFGGRFDFFATQFINTLLAFPTLILGLLLVAVLGPNFVNIVIAISFTTLPSYARISRGATIALKNREYIEACRSMGFSNIRIMTKHILPNVFPQVLVMSSLWTATAIRSEASLAFLGLGVKAPIPTWGGMIRSGFDVLLDMPWLAIAPSIAILLMMFALNLLGDGLRDAVDPKLRQE